MFLKHIGRHVMGQGIVQPLFKLLNARREIGRGSRFVPVRAARRPRVDGEPGSSLGVRQPRARVLLVADNPLVLNATRMLLRAEGYQVTTGLSMADALSQATSDPHIDLLVTDYQLGQETGVELVALLRKLLGQPLKAVLMREGNCSAALDFPAPADSLMRFANRPVDGEKLLSLMGELMDQSPNSSGAASVDPRNGRVREYQLHSGPSPNRTGSLRRQSTPLRFAATCPKCGKARSQDYDLDSLLRLLDGGHPVEAYCATCQEHWAINTRQRAGLGAAAIKFLMQLG